MLFVGVGVGLWVLVVTAPTFEGDCVSGSKSGALGVGVSFSGI